MRLDSIRIKHFRNHRNLEFEPGPSITVIHGRNGTGKTSILEAVHYCAMTRGLAGSTDRECLAFGFDQFLINGCFTSDHGTRTEVKVAFTPEKEKQIFVNEQEITSFSRHIGTIPCITFTPQELSIVTGSPAERRKFIDTAICQYDRRYLSDLIQYRRILQQRNALLAHSGIHQQLAGLEIWTEQLATHAAAIISARQEFLSKYLAYFRGFFERITGSVSGNYSYHCSLGEIEESGRIDSIKERFLQRYTELRAQEIQRKLTLAGPHRDDLRLFADGMEVRKYSSQGQQRSYLITMKLALRQFLQEMNGEHPLTLLDDLFSELDEQTAHQVLETLADCGQVLVTSTHEKKGMDTIACSITTLTG